jgi:hypothetical protein
MAAVAALVGLTGCDTTEWSNPKKSAAETKADIAACNKLGEEDALDRTATPRADTAPRGGPVPGGRGNTPMDLANHSAAARDFHSSFNNCMESKGYTR